MCFCIGIYTHNLLFKQVSDEEIEHLLEDSEEELDEEYSCSDQVEINSVAENEPKVMRKSPVTMNNSISQSYQWNPKQSNYWISPVVVRDDKK